MKTRFFGFKRIYNRINLGLFTFVFCVFIFQGHAKADDSNMTIIIGGNNIASSAKLTASSGNSKTIEAVRDENLKTTFQFDKLDKTRNITFQFSKEVKIKEAILRGNNLWNAKFIMQVLGRFNDENRYSNFDYELPIIASGSCTVTLPADLMVREIILKEKIRLSEELYKIGEIQIFEWPLYTNAAQMSNFLYLYCFSMGDMDKIIEIIRRLIEALNELYDALREWVESLNQQGGRTAQPGEIELQINAADVHFVDNLLPRNGYISGASLYAIPVNIINNGDGTLEGNYVLAITRADVVGDFYREEDRDNINIRNATREILIEEAVEPHANRIYNLYLAARGAALAHGLSMRIELRDNQGQVLCSLARRIPAEEF